LLTQFFKLEEGPNHDLPILKAMAERLPFLDQHASVRSRPQERYVLSGFPIFDSQGTLVGYRGKAAAIRSEEHTSELQSLKRNSYAVFCLNKQNAMYYTN